MRRNIVVVAVPKQKRPAVEACLESLGFDVATYDRLDAAVTAVVRQKAGLLCCDAALLAAAPKATRTEIEQLAQAGASALLLLGEAHDSLFGPAERLPYDFDLNALHETLRRCLNEYSRRHMRLNTSLPGVFVRRQDSHFCEILNLSAGGAFIKTGTPVTAGEETIRLHIPLFGMKRELEIDSRVVFRVSPNEHNNYQQGAGVSFRMQDTEASRHLETFLDQLARYRTLDAVSSPSYVELAETERGGTRQGTRKARERRVLLSP